MKKQTTLIAPAPYASPVCKTVSVGVGRLCQTSPYGDEGEAGSQGSLYDNSGETDY